MILEVGNITTRVASATPEELAWLRDLLAFQDTSRSFVRGPGGVVKHVEPPTLTLLDGDSFPAGLTAHAKVQAAADGVSVAVVDKRARPAAPDLTIETSWLRPYQREVAEVCLAKTKGIVQAPTGSGKTEMAVAMSMMAPGARWLMLTPEKDLMHNAARRYELRTGERSGRIGDQLFELGESFTAATFQSIAARLRKRCARTIEFLAQIDGVVIDEVHQLPAETFFHVAQAINAYWRIGMSGTPLARGDKKSLLAVAATGSIIKVVDPQLLIDNGWLSIPKIRMVEARQTCDASSYRGAYKNMVVKSKARNGLLRDIAIAAAKPGLLFVREAEHGRELVKLLRAAGLRVEFVWGEKSTAQRDQAIDKLRWGDLDLIVCSKVFVTGTDIPELLSVINGAAGKSVIETLQRLGRGMRVAAGKTAFELWDVMDTCAAPVESCGNRWMHRHARERQKTYVQQGYEVLVTSSPV